MEGEFSPEESEGGRGRRVEVTDVLRNFGF